MSPDEVPESDELEQLRDKWLRAKAETDNMRRRAQLDVNEARAYGSSSLLLALLPALDNLQRALAQPPAGIDESFLDGLRLLEQQWRDALAAHGVTRIPIEAGMPVDPALHRVLFEQPGPGVGPGRIALEVTPGYRLHDRLLREAQVAVAPAGPEAPRADL